MSIFDMLYEAGQTIIIVTHEQDIAMKCKRIITLRDGMVSSDSAPAAYTDSPNRDPSEVAS